MKVTKEKAMSNETDLDWLARNVHVWPEGKREVLVCWPRNVDTLIWISVLSDAGWITKDQWLALRAELASQFKPLTSIEDNQEQVMTQQKDMKQDNKWLERGELPPVGVECDIRHSCWNSEKYEKVTVAAITNEYLIVKYATFEQHYMLKDISFRPILTEREAAIEEMKQACPHHGSWDSVGRIYAEALYDAGYRKDPK